MIKFSSSVLHRLNHCYLRIGCRSILDIFPILYYVIFSYRIFGCCNISTYSSFIIIR